MAASRCRRSGYPLRTTCSVAALPALLCSGTLAAVPSSCLEGLLKPPLSLSATVKVPEHGNGASVASEYPVRRGACSRVPKAAKMQ